MLTDTEWQRNLYGDVSLDVFCRHVKAFKETMPKSNLSTNV
jgi:hypothetical protein